ncbi:SGNH hydrolase domain-containing protein [Actinacidiphila glaucinigra]|uniref:SGNH hydrolase domain-containing protein n=1 Tax=Actinacidiphila glaucinigra TaxID=235986 RepID=UPI0037A9EB17
MVERRAAVGSAGTRSARHRSSPPTPSPPPGLCGAGGTCPAVVEDTFVYRDDSHLTESYAEAIAPVLDQTMTTLYGTDLSRHPEPVRPGQATGCGRHRGCAAVSP